MTARPVRLVLWGACLLLGACTCGTPAEAPPPSAPRAKGKAKAKAPEPAAPMTDPGDRPPAPEGPNVLVIVWDTVRADRLSLYGYERDTTPWLSSFAEDAAVYEHAISPAMWTLPSHAAMFTGLPVSAHGANSHHKWLDHRFGTFAEQFYDAGYDTWLFSANPYLQDHTNLGQGFMKREFPWDARWKPKARDATTGKLIDRDQSSALSPAWEQTRYPTGRSNDKFKDAGPVVPEALDAFLDERPGGDRPWLAVVNYMEAHIPRVPSMESREALFSAEEIEAQLATEMSFGFLLAATVGLHEFTPEQTETIGQVYDASLRDLDAATGDLIAMLETRGVLDDTIVILTADHGEHLGEHHIYDHKYSVYNPLIHVPLVVRYPKGMSPGRVDQVVSNLSIRATATELAGLQMPEGTLSQSLLHLDQVGDAAFSELVHATPTALKRMSKAHRTFKPADWKPFLRTWEAVVTDDRKCLRPSEGPLELYAAADPLETRDLAGSSGAEAEALCGRIDTWKASFSAYDPSLAGPEDQPKEMDPAVKSQLEALGYLQEEDGDEDDTDAGVGE